MRYKLKADPVADFAEIMKAVASFTKIFVVSEERRTLSVGDLPKEAIDRLETMGAKIVPEMRYDADRSAA